jgi:hypothetical protein
VAPAVVDGAPAVISAAVINVSGVVSLLIVSPQ